MKNYNYADEIIKDYDQPEAGTKFERRSFGGVSLLNAAPFAGAFVRTNISDRVKAFEEGLRNDNISTEEKP